MNGQNWSPAPPDSEAEKAWDQIMEIAREHCLVVQGGGGTVVLATPEIQRENGVRERTLRAHCRTEAEERP